ncbi:MAG: hypothetical protein J6M66_08465 [Lachnospiraceae bacterium]|nr:hypothetical protein [Lachnospiraceae bacterium]
MFLSFPFFQTVYLNVKYILFNPDRLFETDGEQLIVHWILWRYVIIMPGLPDYVLYIFDTQMSAFVQFEQKQGGF